MKIRPTQGVISSSLAVDGIRFPVFFFLFCCKGFTVLSSLRNDRLAHSLSFLPVVIDVTSDVDGGEREV